MRFAKKVFWSAAIWGLLVVPPLFFLYDTVGRQTPPAITHPEYYYGFASVTTVWQVAFLVIATDPVRFRPLMPIAVLEKLGWLAILTVLFIQHRVDSSVLPFGVVDLVFGILFGIAFVLTPNHRRIDC